MIDSHEAALNRIVDRLMARKKAANMQPPVPIKKPRPRHGNGYWNRWPNHPEARKWHTWAEVGQLMGSTPNAAKEALLSRNRQLYEFKQRRIGNIWYRLVRLKGK